ncbi:nuclear transport factor 2 family protein [Chitinophaga rhizophila]|uniref:Nuclear transport factor 2 family protein n=1 Tax=Chitinophaga rhizophila TaxID=2866212 RepID=A0ABS7GLG2_9BACT|nr:nuclear transport factor 2 family protein [Chitinophaga rhizophila]MBW8688296.1 nuclear transport factor 2 family protein [Chitinophaga rhizophila]
MRILSCLFLLIITAFTASAQTTEDSVKKAVNHLFSAMQQSDSTALMQSFAPGAVLQTVTKDKQGVVAVRTEAISDFAGHISKLPKQAVDEKITFDVVKINGDLAIAWTPYKLYFKEQFVHCGVNSFQLVRLSEGWKIQYLIDTRTTTGCE